MCKWPLEKYKVVDNFAGLDEHKLGQWDSSHRHRTRVLFGPACLKTNNMESERSVEPEKS